VPSNIAFGLIPPLEHRVRSKKDRNAAISERALADLARWEARLACATETR
jgi:methylenetetrahydrofolate--tRNA-(uracil-5-)-methyltransferase